MKVKSGMCRIPDIGSFSFLCPVLEDLNTEEFILASKIMNISLEEMKSLFNRQIEMYLNLVTRQVEREKYAKDKATIINLNVKSPIHSIDNIGNDFENKDNKSQS